MTPPNSTRSDPEPTREGVHFPTEVHRASRDLITIPPKGKRQSERAYRAAYDSDPIVLWERTAGGHLARVRLAGPVSARAWLSSGDLGAQLRNESHRGCVAIFWDSDAPDRSDDPTDRRWVEIIHALQSYTEECV